MLILVQILGSIAFLLFMIGLLNCVIYFLLRLIEVLLHLNTFFRTVIEWVQRRLYKEDSNRQMIARYLGARLVAGALYAGLAAYFCLSHTTIVIAAVSGFFVAF